MTQIDEKVPKPKFGDTLMWLTGLVQTRGIVRAYDVVETKVTGWICEVTDPPSTAGNTDFGKHVLVTPDMNPIIYHLAGSELPEAASELPTSAQ